MIIFTSDFFINMTNRHRCCLKWKINFKKCQKCLKIDKNGYLSQYYADRGLKATIVNKKCQFGNRGSPKLMSTLPLSMLS